MISSTKAPTAETIWCSMGEWLRARYWQTRNLSIGTGDDALWYELAQEVTARVIPPHLFIKSQFHPRREHMRLPSPRSLLRRAAFQRYEDYRRKNRERLLEEMEIELSGHEHHMKIEVALKMSYRGLSKDDAIRRTLQSEEDRFCSLFSFLFASTRGESCEELAYLAKTYYFDAVLQYVPLQSEYDAVLGKHIPSDFRSEAPRAYEGLFS